MVLITRKICLYSLLSRALHCETQEAERETFNKLCYL